MSCTSLSAFTCGHTLSLHIPTPIRPRPRPPPPSLRYMLSPIPFFIQPVIHSTMCPACRDSISNALDACISEQTAETELRTGKNDYKDTDRTEKSEIREAVQASLRDLKMRLEEKLRGEERVEEGSGKEKGKGNENEKERMPECWMSGAKGAEGEEEEQEEGVDEERKPMEWIPWEEYYCDNEEVRKPLQGEEGMDEFGDDRLLAEYRKAWQKYYKNLERKRATGDRGAERAQGLERVEKLVFPEWKGTEEEREAAVNELFTGVEGKPEWAGIKEKVLDAMRRRKVGTIRQRRRGNAPVQMCTLS